MLGYIRQYISYVAIAALSTVLLAGCGKKVSANKDLIQLDEFLRLTEHYESVFQNRVSSLKALASLETDLAGEYAANLPIIDEYRANNYDSALFYINRNIAIARQLDDNDLYLKAKIELAAEHVRGGHFLEIEPIIAELDSVSISQDLLGAYHMMLYNFYVSLPSSSVDEEVNNGYWRKSMELRELLFNDYLDEGTAEWYRVGVELYRNYGWADKADSLGRVFVESTKYGTRDYALAAWAHSFDVKSTAEKTSLLARSYMSDLICANHDCASLEELAMLLFRTGDAERSFNYLTRCMKDSYDFNGNFRSISAARIYPEIEQHYRQAQDNNARVRKMLMTSLFVMLFFVLLMLLHTRMQHSRIKKANEAMHKSNTMLEESNKELLNANAMLNTLNYRIKQSDKLKQDYVTMFLEMLSMNIESTRKYKTHVRQYIKRGNAEDLLKEMDSEVDTGDMSDFYKMFDQTFVSMFPDFVDKFNSLLREEARILPKKNGLLTPELRIFALIKLGVSDSSKIASLLHYSPNTIYNYRSKVKNNAIGEREIFEETVRQL